MQVHQTPTVLLTRPLAASDRFADGLVGADVVKAPFMEIVATGAPIELSEVKALILTSENAVGFLPASRLPAYCVGPRTAAAAQDVGLQPEVLGPDSDRLVDALLNRRPHGLLLHVRGRETRGDVVGRLRNANLNAQSIVAYDQQEVAPNAAFIAALETPHLIVPLFSPRSAALFAKAAPMLRSDAKIVALSDAVRDALPQVLQEQTQVTNAPNGKEMRKALNRLGVQWNSP